MTHEIDIYGVFLPDLLVWFVVALVDTDSQHVEGYFEETKLPHIHVGDPVAVRLLGETDTLAGHVESIAGGI